MRSSDRWTALGAGAIAGATILGLFGRIAMAAVAWAVGAPLNLSAAGLLEVLVLGALLGAAGGSLLRLPLLARRSTGAAGVLMGLLLFALALLLSALGGRLRLEATPLQALTVAVVLADFLLYGVAASGLLALMRRPG
ncbi:MAG: hypothetical protein R3C71_12170 [Candidatus Krumholzibacteriia bacterium]|nr:hypothetical protein [bacterium]MCB9512766.1 hypothetical protein [Candidatus Latescibacterota bacterium]MCB9516852.1 hypothetical protein [Candidatus Latescibacterota bacterium]